MTFDIYEGLIGRDFEFKGCDRSQGATFEHKPCGYVIRIGPRAPISDIARVIAGHDCEREAAYEDALREDLE